MAAAAAKDAPPRKQISGPEGFLLWESFGFPIDLTEIMADEIGMTVDGPGFEAAMKEAQEKSRAGGKKTGGPTLLFEAEATAWLNTHKVPTTNDAAKYITGSNPAATVRAILTLDGFVDSTAGKSGPFGIVLDQTSFYAESGGQVCDTGAIKCGAGVLTVDDTKVAAGFVLHSGTELQGTVKVGDACSALVDYERRGNVMPNHTLTHVLNFALRTVLGEEVNQKGSLVDDEKLRFDFSHNKAMSIEEVKAAEAIVRTQIARKLAVDTREVPLAKAKAISGLRAVFGEVYPDPVRVVSVGAKIDDLLASPGKEDWKGFSIEFCGGTHLGNTADAELFVLMSEEGVAKGIRRIVGATKGAARAALATAAEVAARVKACDALSGPELAQEMATLKGIVDTAVMPAVERAEIREEMVVITKKITALAKEAMGAAKEAAIKAVEELAASTKAAGAKYFVVQLAEGTDPGAMKDAALKAFGAGIACALFAADTPKGKAICYVSVPPAVGGLDVMQWLNAACVPIEGKGGGGKGGTAQGQGNKLEGLPAAIAAAKAFAAK
mmetsp:Transcript_36931/g.91246  ORF Transcript_36931/g.91246 Transcript_36931/m.91246 type:complete len:553 (-) Transcript_36931:556-2214(-)